MRTAFINFNYARARDKISTVSSECRTYYDQYIAMVMSVYLCEDLKPFDTINWR